MSGWLSVKSGPLKYYHKTAIDVVTYVPGLRRGHGASPQAGALRLLAPLPGDAQEELPPSTHDLPQRVSCQLLLVLILY